ncbi:L-threonylcarbamoyladenylate synthase [Nioella sediminis]|jgi:L-threonylcarbamoyladenylate synthase|uniref:L-threonylcarbamoyladenylate synthase n=1 Tax=Nioella sediminis TaxID=1912092 RepID=UPI0008FD4B37|nr:L-threonylcarbamoyladenylate synthase [Nioella sediminis]TBX19600.1 translation factor Sua5 [Roseovarius sp. JS7-11]
MSHGKTELLSPTPAGIARAVDLLSDGQLVALPTETVYGLAGDATSDMACARIFEAKGRPRFNPLIVHLPSLDAVERIAILNDPARALAAAFWPGPLTMVLPLREGHSLSPLVTAGLQTVAIRLPAHPLMRAVLDACGGPIAAPSANLSGRISPTTAAHVLAGLDGRIAAVLDGGPCGVGLESTILAPQDTGTRLLREGGLPREAIEPLTGPLTTDTTPGKVQAPGQLSSHYAPKAQVRLNAPLTDPNAIRVGFGPGSADLSLSPTGDLIEAAANLFSTLHAADDLAKERNAREIHIAPIPDQGLGRAINDRLTRAAAPR